MNWSEFENWLSNADILVVAITILGAMYLAAALGAALRARSDRLRPHTTGEEGEGLVVSAALGLLALLIGFTFSLAADRFDARRLLVLEEANAIGATYLRAQLLDEPHRARMTDLLIRYLDNRIAFAGAKAGQNATLLAANDALVTDIWAATSAAFDSIKGLDFSSTYLDSVNNVVALDASRKAARRARVPTEVFVVLIIYLVASAGVVGNASKGLTGRLAAGLLLALFSLSLILIIDTDRPTHGGIVEGQQPMEELRKSLASRPPAIFDGWRTQQQ
jgi:hypothetical protein